MNFHEIILASLKKLSGIRDSSRYDEEIDIILSQLEQWKTYTNELEEQSKQQILKIFDLTSKLKFILKEMDDE